MTAEETRDTLLLMRQYRMLLAALKAAILVEAAIDRANEAA